MYILIKVLINVHLLVNDLCDYMLCFDLNFMIFCFDVLCNICYKFLNLRHNYEKARSWPADFKLFH